MVKVKLKIKKDRFLRERGGAAKILDISCAKCNKLIFVYQKDGPGWLKRCYLNRIMGSELKISDLDLNTKNLICSCGQIIGSLTKHKDGRLAFSMIRGNFKRSNHKESEDKK
jgi:hypothetical protein